MRARAVVVSGGAINTPAILLRSGLKHPMIGRHLCLHPVLAVGGVFPEDYDGEHGAGEDDPKRSTGGSMAAAAGTAGKQARFTGSFLLQFWCMYVNECCCRFFGRRNSS